MERAFGPLLRFNPTLVRLRRWFWHWEEIAV
jgi:hypothetical protein